jgi:hypothetical protein
MPYLPSWDFANAICVPSGDQLGMKPPSSVSRVSAEPSAFIT